MNSGNWLVDAHEQNEEEQERGWARERAIGALIRRRGARRAGAWRLASPRVLRWDPDNPECPLALPPNEARRFDWTQERQDESFTLDVWLVHAPITSLWDKAADP